MKIHHTGYAVQDIQKAAEKFLLLGFKLSGGVVDDPSRKVSIQFLEDPSGARVELVAPLNCAGGGGTSPVDGWLKKNRNSPYHICYESKNIDDDVKELRNNGFLVVQPPSPAIAIENRPVVFLYNNAAGLIELVEV